MASNFYNLRREMLNINSAHHHPRPVVASNIADTTDPSHPCRLCKKVFRNTQDLIAHIDSHMAQEESAIRRLNSSSNYYLNNNSERKSSSPIITTTTSSTISSSPLFPPSSIPPSLSPPMPKQQQQQLLKVGNNHNNNNNNNNNNISIFQSPPPSQSMVMPTQLRRNSSSSPFFSGGLQVGSSSTPISRQMLLSPHQINLSYAGITNNNININSVTSTCEIRQLSISQSNKRKLAAAEVEVVSPNDGTRAFIGQLEKPIKKIDFIDLVGMDDDNSDVQPNLSLKL